MDIWTIILQICERSVMYPAKFDTFYEQMMRKSKLLIEDPDGIWFRQMMYAFQNALIKYIDSHCAEHFVQIPDLTDRLVAYPMFKNLWRDRRRAEHIIKCMDIEARSGADGELEYWIVAEFMDRINASIRKAVAEVDAERRRRTHTYKEELIATVYNPDRACRFADKYGMEPMDWLMLQAEGTAADA